MTFLRILGPAFLAKTALLSTALGFPAAIFNGAMKKGSTSQQKEDKQGGV